MNPDRDEDTGQFSEQYADEAFLQAVTETATATTAKVADSIGCSYDLAYRRLNKLADEDRVEKEKVGGSFVWSIIRE